MRCSVTNCDAELKTQEEIEAETCAECQAAIVNLADDMTINVLGKC